MHRTLASSIVLLALAGCSRVHTPDAGSGMAAAPAPARAPEAKMASRDEVRTLAYEHTVSLKAPADRVPEVFRAVEATCAELAAQQCELLDSRMDSGREPFASLKLRAPHASIETVLGALPRLGEVTSRSTRVEDLAVAIADSKKQLSIKTDYRARLEALLPKASNDVESLVKINQELAEVQGEIESAQGQDAYLAKRVDTELLTVEIQSPQYGSVWASLSDTPDEIARNLANGAATAVATVAFLVPWVVLLAILGIAFRAWRRLRRKRGAA